MDSLSQSLAIYKTVSPSRLVGSGMCCARVLHCTLPQQTEESGGAEYCTLTKPQGGTSEDLAPRCAFACSVSRCFSKFAVGYFL